MPMNCAEVRRIYSRMLVLQRVGRTGAAECLQRVHTCVVISGYGQGSFSMDNWIVSLHNMQDMLYSWTG